jgi:hypothetical protein
LIQFCIILLHEALQYWAIYSMRWELREQPEQTVYGNYTFEPTEKVNENEAKFEIYRPVKLLDCDSDDEELSKLHSEITSYKQNPAIDAEVPLQPS